MNLPSRFVHVWVPPLDRDWNGTNLATLFQWCSETFGVGSMEHGRWYSVHGVYGFVDDADLAMFLIFVSGFSVPAKARDSAFYYCPYIPLTITSALPNGNSVPSVPNIGVLNHVKLPVGSFLDTTTGDMMAPIPGTSFNTRYGVVKTP